MGSIAPTSGHVGDKFNVTINPSDAPTPNVYYKFYINIKENGVGLQIQTLEIGFDRYLPTTFATQPLPSLSPGSHMVYYDRYILYETGEYAEVLGVSLGSFTILGEEKEGVEPQPQPQPIPGDNLWQLPLFIAGVGGLFYYGQRGRRRKR